MFLGDLIAAWQFLKGPTRKMERDLLQEHGATRQGEIASNCQRVNSD